MNNKFKKYYQKKGKKSGLSRIFVIAIISIIIAVIILLTLIFFRIRSVYLNVLSSRQDLGYALTLVGEGDFNKASEFAGRATDGFVFAGEVLRDLQNNFVIRNVKFLYTNLDDFKNLAKTAEILSRSAEKALILIKDVEDVVSGKKAGNFLEFSEEEKIKILQKLYESYPEMQGIKANIDLSLVYLNRVKGNKLLSSYSSQIDGFKKQLSDISLAMDRLVSLSSIIPVLTGYPEPVSYLVVLQNSNELRPTGGFIGTYGILEIKLGDITKLETHDIYHLDMPASLNKSFNIAPPEPIRRYLGVNQWFMRDSNWSPDWPTSAKKLLWFYEEEMRAANRNSEIIDFSGVMAITPRLITDLLYIVGPIEIDNQIYDKDNFVDVLQYEVEMAFREEGISEWDRKMVIGEILKELKIRLFNLSSDRWLELVDVFNQNISQKNILVYLDDEYSRKISSNLDWDGEIKNAWIDYLMIIDANLAAFKTDRVMDKKINYYLNEEHDGRFKARVELIYKNNGWFDWQTTRYRTFTRAYVPYGSSFVSSSGLTTSPATIGRDEEISFPKNYWGGFLSVEPGQEGVIIFEYYLPDDVVKIISENLFYSLKLQKQPGNNISQFYAELIFSKNIKSIKGEGDILIDDNKVFWTNSLDRDYYLEVRF